MYIDIALIVVVLLSCTIVVGIWWERAKVKRKRIIHGRRQAARQLKREELLKNGKLPD